MCRSTALRALGASRGFDSPGLLVVLAFAALGVVVSVVVHESGHLLAGRAMGWQPVAFGFGPFEFERKPDGWRRNRVKMLWGAFVRQVPPDFTKYRAQKTVTTSCGPL